MRGNDKELVRLRVLVSAYACEPDCGSEPGVGWNCVRQVGRFHEAWVITRANNRGSIEGALAMDPSPNLHFVYFDLPHWMRFWKKGRRGINLYYYLWQIGAYLTGRKLHRDLRFDLAHHVTFAKYWIPSFLPLLPVPSCGDRWAAGCRHRAASGPRLVWGVRFMRSYGT